MVNGLFIIGPAGSGKTSFCNELKKTIISQRKSVAIINLDPASEKLIYEPEIDIKNLIKCYEVGEELGLGPNGSLLFCMEYLLDNLNWLIKEISFFRNTNFLIFDFPGQIEIIMNNSYMNDLIYELEKKLEISLHKFFLLDAQFISDISKYIGGILTSFICMIINDHTQHNILSKINYVKNFPKEIINKYLNPCMSDFLFELNIIHGKSYKKLNFSVLKLLEDFSFMKFIPLEITNVNYLVNIYRLLENNVEDS